MFSSSDQFDLSSLLGGQSLSGATSLLGTSSASPLSSGQDTSGLFQLLLAQMLIKLLDRIEAQVPSMTSNLFAAETGALTDPSAAAGTTPVSSAVRSAYGVTPVGATDAATSGARAIVDYPRPVGDNGRGLHWIPTVSQSADAVDRFVSEAKAMNVKWVTFLNDGSTLGANDYLVKQLSAAGIEPVMRVYTDGVKPIDGDLGAMVRHYKALGVDYFQLYNEPNLVAENFGETPSVDRYLDGWIPAAQTVIANGGLPGIGALAPTGEADDLQFLSGAINGLKTRGQVDLLDNAWLAIHNYQGDLSLDDIKGYSRYLAYADVLQQSLGRVLPMISTEGGGFAQNDADDARRTQAVLGAYQRVASPNAPDYLFNYTYWVIANAEGGGHDPAWEWQALFQNGHTSELVDALKKG